MTRASRNFSSVSLHVEVPERALGIGPRRLEPRVLIGGVVHDEVDDHLQAALVGSVDELDEVRERAELRQHLE